MCRHSDRRAGDEARTLRPVSRLWLRRTIVGLSVVPIVTGTTTVLLGSSIIQGGGEPTASTESELRFYGAWWIGAGLFLGSLAPHVEQRTVALRAVCGLLVLGAIGRALAIADAGRPRTIFLALLAAELVVATVLVVWQSRVARAATETA